MLTKKDKDITAIIKHRMIRNWAKEVKIFVETGTYLGDTSWAVRNTFREIHTVEMSEELYNEALKRFKNTRHVHLYQGNSEDILPSITSKITENAVFFLDAHHSGGVTTKGNDNTPIVKEIKEIFKRERVGDIVIVDDADSFTGKDGYPTAKEMQILAEANGFAMEIECNMMKLVKK